MFLSLTWRTACSNFSLSTLGDFATVTHTKLDKKRQRLVIEDQLEIVKRFENGEKQSHIAKDLGLNKTLVHNIIKKREKVSQLYVWGLYIVFVSTTLAVVCTIIRDPMELSTDDVLCRSTDTTIFSKAVQKLFIVTCYLLKKAWKLSGKTLNKGLE